LHSREMNYPNKLPDAEEGREMRKKTSSKIMVDESY